MATTWTANTGVSLSNNNLTVATTGAYACLGSVAKSTGKWYFEATFDNVSTNHSCGIGIANVNVPLSTDSVWKSANQMSYCAAGLFSPSVTAYGSQASNGDVIGIAVDMDNGTLTFYKNGVSMGVASNYVKNLGEIYPYFANETTSAYTAQVTANFGATAFVHTPPSDYLPWNIKMQGQVI